MLTSFVRKFPTKTENFPHPPTITLICNSRPQFMAEPSNTKKENFDGYFTYKNHLSMKKRIIKDIFAMTAILQQNLSWGSKKLIWCHNNHYALKFIKNEFKTHQENFSWIFLVLWVFCPQFSLQFPSYPLFLIFFIACKSTVWKFAGKSRKFREIFEKIK